MCGIAGFNWRDEEKIALMQSCLSHRGPDAKGVFVDDRVSLGHTRLSIIDLSTKANQPMVDEESGLVIIYNGEIYNFKELREELRLYHLFKTESDTEVILAGYKKWGRGIVQRLNGMFAFAIYEKASGDIVLARDRAGIKPLYYYWSGEKLIFASELKAILKHGVSRKLNVGAFNRYMRILYSPEPETLIENIYKLPPGSILSFKDGKISIEKYGEEVASPSEISYQEAVAETKKKVVKAVERQLVSDVPLGVYLSGGMDSSAVLAAMTHFTKEIKTFSVGFELENKDEEEKFNHDFNLARRTAEHFGTEHFELKITSQDALRVFEEMVLHNDEPVSNPTSLPMLLLSRFAKDEVSVVLSGNGGDELFGGYDRYRMALLASYYKKLPQLVRRVLGIHPKLAKLDYGLEVDLFAQFMFEKDAKLEKVISSRVFEDDTGAKKFFQEKYFSEKGEDVVSSLMSADRRGWLVDQALNLGDKMSMAGSLEERVPFLDNELVSFAETLPTSYKVDLFKTKMVLKDAFRQDLPSFLYDEPKRGWFSPGAKWLREKEFSAFAKEVLSPEYYEGTKSLFNWSIVEKLLDDHLKKKEYNLTILWAILTFQVWAKKFNISI